MKFPPTSLDGGGFSRCYPLLPLGVTFFFLSYGNSYARVSRGFYVAKPRVLRLLVSWYLDVSVADQKKGADYTQPIRNDR